MTPRRVLLTTLLTLWAWLLCVGGFWLAEHNTTPMSTWLGLACVCVGLHVFARHAAPHAFPHAATWLRRTVETTSLASASLCAAVGAMNVMS